ncbi:methyltransferase domain-containing protein [Helicobacter ibis]|uniref:Methyltransferase domain-containing protein n=1 Tax=Helicobacter ibis TaxID=2962633 RepID=A0ABT4VE03_9HELI|nr:methyltransferase domain-containing protein [Helicobacter ibis]MDA3968929.1 methyltransferase domain-containing protein [Helicobacter ibis]
MEWKADKYLKFKEYRNLANIDLINAIKRHGNSYSSILDLGCGPGNSTTLLAQTFKDSKILALDNSQDMINKAKNLKLKNCTFELCDIDKNLNTTNKYNLIFTNASIHWIKNQTKLLKNITNMLEKNGIFAMQIPLDSKSIFHKSAKTLIKKYNTKIDRIFFSLPYAKYYDILSKKCKVEMWESTYFHRLDDIDSILQWYEGSSLTSYTNKLEKDSQKDFLDELLKILSQKIKPQQNGDILLPFPRLFIISKYCFK